MQRFAVVAKHNINIRHMRRLPEGYGFTYDKERPDFVISYGGDGSLLKAERLYPGIPKIPIRNSRICRKCHGTPTEHVFDLLRKKRYRLVRMPKLTAEIDGKATGLSAMNDIVIRNKRQQQALRFSVKTGGKEARVIGDGVVIATPFGAGGYYSSITRQTFEKGFGIAFNNPTVPKRPWTVPYTGTIAVRLDRHDVSLTLDNHPKAFLAREGSTIKIHRDRGMARLVHL